MNVKRVYAMLTGSLSLAATEIALAAGDSGTGAVGEIELSGAQFGMLAGGAVVLGLAIWLVIRVLNR